VSLCRDRVFTSAECAVLRLLQPHLAAAWGRVTSAQTTWARTADRSLGLSSELRPQDMAAGQYQSLRAYFPGWRNSGELPDPVFEWARASQAELGKPGPRQPLRALTVSKSSGILYLRYFLMGAGAELYFMERPAVAPLLSQREEEVLHWIAQGKRDEEIGIILGVATKTVAKHVEHVLAKLRVTNRTAAVAASLSRG
jgi:DNA-binding CsgD family transcriptional regulator